MEMEIWNQKKNSWLYGMQEDWGTARETALFTKEKFSQCKMVAGDTSTLRGSDSVATTRGWVGSSADIWVIGAVSETTTQCPHFLVGPSAVKRNVRNCLLSLPSFSALYFFIPCHRHQRSWCRTQEKNYSTNGRFSLSSSSSSSTGFRAEAANS